MLWHFPLAIILIKSTVWLRCGLWSAECLAYVTDLHSGYSLLPDLLSICHLWLEVGLQDWMHVFVGCFLAFSLMGLVKGILFQTWPFWVSMSNFRGCFYINVQHFRLEWRFRCWVRFQGCCFECILHALLNFGRVHQGEFWSWILSHQAPENRPCQKEISFPTTSIRGLCLF